LAEYQEKATRGVVYAFTRVIIFVVAVLIVALGFFTGMNSMNVNVVIKDAFAMRQQAVLQPKSMEESDLPKLFTQNFIITDSVLNSSEYKDYEVTYWYECDGIINYSFKLIKKAPPVTEPVPKPKPDEDDVLNPAPAPSTDWVPWVIGGLFAIGIGAAIITGQWYVIPIAALA
jgi:hypothetical protein